MKQEQLKYISPHEIFPHENHCNNRLKILLKKISKEGMWTSPLLVDRHNMILMDGHHRLAVAKIMNLKKIPCLMLDYISVAVISRTPKIIITPEIIKNAALSGSLLPFKSTKHLYSEFSHIPCSIPLSVLKIFSGNNYL